MSLQLFEARVFSCAAGAAARAAVVRAQRVAPLRRRLVVPNEVAPRRVINTAFAGTNAAAPTAAAGSPRVSGETVVGATAAPSPAPHLLGSPSDLWPSSVKVQELPGALANESSYIFAPSYEPAQMNDSAAYALNQSNPYAQLVDPYEMSPLEAASLPHLSNFVDAYAQMADPSTGHLPMDDSAAYALDQAYNSAFMTSVQNLVESEDSHWEWTGTQWAWSQGSGLSVTQAALEMDNFFLEAATVPLPPSSVLFQSPQANETLPLAAAVLLATAASVA